MQITAAAALLLSLSALAPAGATVDEADPGYVLHEWGTFTTLAGSDGLLLDGIHADDHALPAFVHGRDAAPEGFHLASLKMETPVLYVYSDREREISARVRFPGGLLTTWYPDVRAVEPPVGPAPALRNGSLVWGSLKVLAPGAGLDLLPAVDPEDPWAFARAPESNVLRLCGVGTTGVEHERYLFYRGLGRVDLPLGVSVEEGRVVLRGLDESRAEARVLSVENGRIRTAVLRPAEGSEGRVRVATLADLVETNVEDVARALADELTCEGLTRAEAVSMVRTWRKSWLESPGTRVLAPLPRRVTDAILPLEVLPAPRETVRVMVARLDILTSAEERRAEETARSAATGAEARERLGRFAWPILRRVARTTGDPEIARRAEALSRELEPTR
jgi:hypothetical protein